MKYTGPKCRLCRREGMKLFLKGDKCFSQKCPIVKRNYAPGMHQNTRSKPTEYSRQLREKQRAKRIFNITEKQFAGYYQKAMQKKGQITGDLLLKLLELRLDNVIFKTGLAESRNQARQMIGHGLIKLNGKRVTLSSIQLKVGDTFEVVGRMQTSPLFTKKKDAKIETPSWLQFDVKTMKGSIVRDLVKDDLSTDINAQMIVEYYSR